MPKGNPAGYLPNPKKKLKKGGPKPMPKKPKSKMKKK